MEGRRCFCLRRPPTKSRREPLCLRLSWQRQRQWQWRHRHHPSRHCLPQVLRRRCCCLLRQGSSRPQLRLRADRRHPCTGSGGGGCRGLEGSGCGCGFANPWVSWQQVNVSFLDACEWPGSCMRCLLCKRCSRCCSCLGCRRHQARMGYRAGYVRLVSPGGLCCQAGPSTRASLALPGWCGPCRHTQTTIHMQQTSQATPTGTDWARRWVWSRQAWPNRSREDPGTERIHRLREDVPPAGSMARADASILCDRVRSASRRGRPGCCRYWARLDVQRSATVRRQQASAAERSVKGPARRLSSCSC